MSFAVDTNVLLRSIDDGHAAQPVAQHALLQVRNTNDSLFIFPQNLIEFWAVATRPIPNNGLGWTTERTEQELANLKKFFVVAAESDAILPQWETLVVRHQVIGKQVHDAHLVAAMLVHDVTHLLTFNTDDFKRYNKITVVNPQDVQ